MKITLPVRVYKNPKLIATTADIIYGPKNKSIVDDET
jgi:hypothetical protein